MEIKLTEEQDKVLNQVTEKYGNGVTPEEYLRSRVCDILEGCAKDMKNEDIIKISDAVRFADIATIENIKTALGIVKVEAEPVIEIEK